MVGKTDLRQVMLERRQQLTPDAIVAAGEAALQQLTPILIGKWTVMLYMPFRGELSTLPLLGWLQATGRSIVLPLTDRRSRSITPAQVSGVEALAAGAYGIMEPAPGKFVELVPEQLDAVIVPGVCFDQHGYRIGYGGGYYDRFLPRLRVDCLTAGLGYDWQVVPQLAPDPWDQALSYIITDCRTILVDR